DLATLPQVGFWLVLLVVNSYVEEAMSRAFPMRLFYDRGIVFRVVLTSLVFAALHLADEGFRLDAFISRAMYAVPLALAYIATEDVWLSAGIHTGMNYAIVARSGAWHSGALVRLQGSPLVSDDVTACLVALLAVGVYASLARQRMRYRAGVAPVPA